MSLSMTEVMNVVHRYVPKGFSPKIALILGSGLATVGEQMTNVVSLPYQAIPGLQSGAVAGHASLFMMGNLADVPIICMRGRLHLYEGVAYDSITTLIRIVKSLGASVLLSTCATGSLREDVGPGELMMIQDHINFHPGNPLLGQNDDSFGPRFVSMDNAYDSDLQEIMSQSAKKLNIPLAKGIYISTLGPSFETPAEIRAFRQWGADAVGMSVVPEVIVARHCGMRVACVAAITNFAAGMTQETISHEGTLHYGEIAARKLVKLVPAFIRDVANEMV